MKWRAPRVAYALFHGDPGDLQILHSCDNPPCLNDRHLSADTDIENKKQAKERGRMATGDRHGLRLHPESVVRGERHHAVLNPEKYYGEGNPMSKLTPQQVVEIRQVYRPRKGSYFGNAKHLGSIYGVSAIAIIRIGQMKSYVNVVGGENPIDPIPQWAESNVDKHHRKGEECHQTKLTEEQVMEIRRRYIPAKRGHRNGSFALAREFGITPSHLVNIASGKKWKEAKTRSGDEHP